MIKQPKFRCPICNWYEAKPYPRKGFKHLNAGLYICDRCGTIRSNGRLMKIGKKAYKLGIISK